MILGLDGARSGARSGWAVVALGLGPEPHFLWSAFRESAEELLREFPTAVRLGVDMPLGLVESGWRSADLAGRAALGKRRATLFCVPPRPAVFAADYQEAGARTRQLCGQGLSRQAWGLHRKIVELDALAGDARLLEVHPELVFAGLAGAPLADPKRTKEGEQVRRSLLGAVVRDLPADFAATGELGANDALDALACAWAAGQVHLGRGRRFVGTPPQIDPLHNREIAIHG